MLKGVDPVLGPDLLHLLAAMGHGDELAIVDRNFPAASHAQRLIRLDGVDLITACVAIGSLLPVDTFVDVPLLRMEVVGDADTVTPVQAEAHAAWQLADSREFPMGSLSRHAFYGRTRDCFGVVQTSERRPYGCLIVTKGVITD
jgi:L-fucose mutarotase